MISSLTSEFVGMNSFEFIGGREKVLDKPAFKEMDYSTVSFYPARGVIFHLD